MGNYKPTDVRLFSFIDLPDVLIKKRRHIMSKKNKEKATKKKENQRIRFLSPDSSLYKSSATIILRGKSKTDKDKQSKLLEFLSRAPISFNSDDSE